MIDQPCPVTGLAADEALNLARGRTARLVTGAVQAAAIRRRLRIGAYALQDRGLDTCDANLALGHRPDERDYTSAAQMLHALGANRIGLLSNNPDKGAQLARLGITIVRQVPTALHLTGTNAAYLAAKARRGGHDLLSRGLERAAEAHRDAGPAHLGIAD